MTSYKNSAFFRTALDADAYFRGENPPVGRKTILKARKVVTRDAAGMKRVRSEASDVVGNRIPSGILQRLVTQQAMYLLGNGCLLGSPEMRAALGSDFDRVLAQMGEKAILHGVCWGFLCGGHVEPLPACAGPLSGTFCLPDEMTGEPMLGVHFWQLGPERPLYLRVFTETGVSVLRHGRGETVTVRPEAPYALRRTVSALGETEEPLPVPRLPLVPFWGNAEHRSGLCPAIRAKIDAYDRILSDFADNLDRANDVYWVLNNFGGTLDDIAETLDTINRLKAVASMSDGSGGSATAEPRTIDVPYAARQAALALLEKEIYRDWMALDVSELTGGSLTNVAIRAASAGLELKADRFEWEAFAFVRGLLSLLGWDTDAIRFPRRAIANESETVADIAAMRPDIDRHTALRLNPYIQPEEIDAILRGEAGGMSS